MALDRVWAERFFREWLDAWNAHDLDAILSHYAPGIVFHSPRIGLVMGDGRAFVVGKPDLHAYWRRALDLAPNLRFEGEALFLGSDALTILYRNHRGQRAAETFVFGTDGLVTESIATYA